MHLGLFEITNLKKKRRKKTLKKNNFPLPEVFAIETIIAVGSLLFEPK